MTTEKILQELVDERTRITAAIIALQHGGNGGINVTGTRRRARTQEQKHAQSEKMKLYWASRKSGAKKLRKAA